MWSWHLLRDRRRTAWGTWLVLAVVAALAGGAPEAEASHTLDARVTVSPPVWKGLGPGSWWARTNRLVTWEAEVVAVGEATEECSDWSFVIYGVSEGAYQPFHVTASRMEARARIVGTWIPTRNHYEVKADILCNGLDSARDISDSVFVTPPEWPSDQARPGQWLTPGKKDNWEVGTGAAWVAALGTCAVGAFVPAVGWGACGVTVATAVGSSVIVLIDPPDLNFNSVAAKEPFPVTRVRVRCRRLPKRLRGKRVCRQLKAALSRYQAAASETASVTEALAIAANRFSAAANAGDLGGQLLQVAARKVHSHDLALAYAHQNVQGAALARVLKRARFDVRLNRRQLAREIGRRMALRGVSNPLRERLSGLVDPQEAVRVLRDRYPIRAPLRLRRSLAQPLPTGELEEDYRSLTLQEAALLGQAALDAQPADEAIREVRDHLAGMAGSCDPAEAEREADQAALAATRASGPYGRLVQLAVDPVSSRSLGRPAGCSPPLVGPFTEFGTFGSAAGQFNVPTDVVVTSDAIYVADQKNFRVQQFTRDGAFVRQWGGKASNPSTPEPGRFSTPVGLAADSIGNIYVTDFEQSRVQKFTSDGVFIKAWGTPGAGDGEFANLGGIAIDSLDNVYVVDANNSRIQRFTPDGVFVSVIGGGDPAAGGLSSPRGIATDAAGNIFVANRDRNEIVVFGRDGDLLRKWGAPGTEGPGKFNGAYDVAIDPSGNVWVADRANWRLQKFTSEGQYLGEESAFGVVGQTFVPIAVATDASYGVYAADLERDRIIRFGDRR